MDLPLEERLFVAGPNASGKSNLLDAFRFLRDIAKGMGGGLQEAVRSRGGLSRLRCLAARSQPDVEVEVSLRGGQASQLADWRYSIGMRQESRGERRLLLNHERVWKGGDLILNRPDDLDRQDPMRLTQTHLEQIAANAAFRPVAEALRGTLYLHLVPQLLKHPEIVSNEVPTEDYFGLRLLERILGTPEKTRRSRLRKIEAALQIAVPELQNLTEVRDERGRPHLEAVYRHWRPGGGLQREDQFSDGTLRLIGLFWALLDGDGLLLLEEPEISLHAAIVRRLPPLIWRMQQAKRRQVILSSHSADLFSDKGIQPSEVALLRPRASEGTVVELASRREDIKAMLEGGMTMAEAILPLTAPARLEQLTLFE